MINYILIYTHTHTHTSLYVYGSDWKSLLAHSDAIYGAGIVHFDAVQTTPTNSPPRARRHILVNLMIETKFVAHTTPHREGNSAVVMLPDGMGWALARSIIYPSLLWPPYMIEGGEGGRERALLIDRSRESVTRMPIVRSDRVGSSWWYATKKNSGLWRRSKWIKCLFIEHPHVTIT